jgi:sugar lactone lactonase YvrE
MRRNLFAICLTICGILADSSLVAVAAEPMVVAPNRTTPIAADQLDPNAFLEYVAGQSKSLAAAARENSPQWVLWTDRTQPGHSGLKFGDSTSPGPRHLVIGLKQAVAVGTVFCQGGGRLSVLKPAANYPGDPANEADWIPAERLVDGAVSTAEAEDDEFAAWTLPPGTHSRALRFSHLAKAADPAYAGYLGGAFVTVERWSNLAPQAQVVADTQPQRAQRINNGKDDSFQAWENLDSRSDPAAEQPVVSPEHASQIILTWPAPVSLAALNALGAGFGAAEVQAYVGPDDRHPRDASDTDWQTIGRYAQIESGYPCRLWPNRLDFPAPQTTRGIRLIITAPAKAKHPHLVGRVKDGKRVWLSELMTLSPLGDAPLAAVKFPEIAAPHPPIPVHFQLAKPGYVSLVIEDESGRRVRNLISETPFSAGDNTAWWDGADDLGRDVDAARHGYYHIPAQFVSPGKYRVRGLVRGKIEPHYEFSIYSGGHPAWETADKRGGWLTNHTPPQAALFVPANKAPTGEASIYLGSAVSEGGAGLAWVDRNGKKLGGRGWIGGNWTAAPFLARDAGPKADPDMFAYVAATWTASSDNKDRTHGELRITGLTRAADRAIVKLPFSPPAGDEGDHHWIDQLGGLAVRDGLAVAAMNKLDRLFFIDARSGRKLGEAVVKSPRGLAFDGRGRLLVLSGNKLLRFEIIDAASAKLSAAKTLVADGLEYPQGIVLDRDGHILISDWGNSHQVKIFTADGQPLRVVGKPGAPAAGLYDPLHMNHPSGLAIDDEGRLWVTERDYLPKRVSVWNPAGMLWKAFYGPSKYGGGGTLDPQDKSRFYYADEGRGAMEFHLDWKTGESELVRVFARRGPDSMTMPERTAAPETALYRDGRRYFTNCYNSNPTGGSTAFLFIERDGIAQPIAGMGRATNWSIFETDKFRSRPLPAGANWKNEPPMFLWSDTDEDGAVQATEVVFAPGPGGGITVLPDLSFCVSRSGSQALRFAPKEFTPSGTPRYDFARGEVLAEGVQPPASSGGDQVLVDAAGRAVVTLGIEPFARQSLSGAKNGVPRWSYPSLWPGLHAAHESPQPDRLGELIGTTRLLGGFITPRDSDAGPLWAINANLGTVYVFTSDGLFVATLFRDKRQGTSWSMPSPERNMSLDGFTLGEENFWPTWSQSPAGDVYLMNGAKASLVRLDGFESIRRLPARELAVTAEQLQKSQDYLVAEEASRQKAQGRGALEIALRKQSPTVDGQLAEWSDATWVDIDKTGTAANFNSKSKPYDVTAAAIVAEGRLFVAYRTGDAKLLANSGEVPNAPFKTGGALDLMLAADPQAAPDRTSPVAGDLRLLVTQIGGETKAVLYRPVVPGTKEPVPFSSPWRTITLDRVDDVSRDVKLAGADGNFEFSVPLSLLGLKPQAGLTLRGDVGILRGDGMQTTARVYWSNKSTGITSDVPSEAMLQPRLWGRVEFESSAR